MSEFKVWREFVESHIVLPTGQYEGSFLREAYQPAMFRIIEQFLDGGYRKLVLSAPAQCGKTFMLQCMLLYETLVRSRDIVYASITEAQAQDKYAQLVAILNASNMMHALPRRGTGARGGFGRVLQIGGRMIYLLTSESRRRSIAGYTAPVVMITELDGWNMKATTEAHRYKQIEARAEAFKERRIMLESTPTSESGNIMVEWSGGSRSIIAAPCPHCSTLISPTRKDFHLDPTPAFACPQCGGEINDEARHAMIRACTLVHERDSDVLSVRMGLFFNAFKDIAEIATRERENIANGMQYEREMLQLLWGEPVSATQDSVTVNAQPTGTDLTRLMRGVFPDQCDAVACGIDVGAHALHYVVLALAQRRLWIVDYGSMRARSQYEQQAIREMSLMLKSQISQRYRTLSGQSIDVRLVLIDAKYAPDIVSDIATTYKWFMAQGYSKRFFKLKQGEHQPRIIAFNIPLDIESNTKYCKWKDGMLHINSDACKSALRRAFNTNVAWCKREDSFMESYFISHLKSEYELSDGTWKRIKERENHMLDAASLALLMLRLQCPDLDEYLNQPCDDAPSIIFTDAPESIQPTQEPSAKVQAISRPKINILTRRRKIGNVRARY
jgi:phage terminase large subunit GpA-like protein